MAWTDIINTQVAVGAPLDTALMTALRDNASAIGQRGVNTPKILGNVYDRQVFVANGTWTKPSNAETGDTVVVWGIGGGGSGARTGSNGSGGGGGAGFLYRITDIDSIASTMAVVIGAGAAVNTGTAGAAGGNTSFGTSGASGYCRFTGGTGGLVGVTPSSRVISYSEHLSANTTTVWDEGRAGQANNLAGEPTGGSSHWGGGGGGKNDDSEGGFSSNAGHGGLGNSSANAETGAFPGGGGGSSEITGNGGGGGDGYMVVYCIKEGA